MRYDGKIREKLKLVRLYNDNIEYELSYLLSSNCRTFTVLKKHEIINYVNEHYLWKKQIDYGSLVNDINVFKSYRDDVDINVRKENDFGQFITISLALTSTIISVMLDYDSKKTLLGFAGLIVLVSFGYYSFNIGRRSESYKLKVINNVIYTLEVIKEDMEKNENFGMKNTEMNSNVNDYQSDCKTDEKITKAKNFTKNDEGSYDGLELTEVREIRTYKADKSKYSPRAMHHRKRR